MRNNQIILGAGGSVGNALAKELKSYTENITLFSRNPKKVNTDDNLISGDLLDAIQTENALKNMDIAYLVVGLPYNTKIWERDFLKIVENVIKGCKIHKVPLVFLDNVYMYDPEDFEDLNEDAPLKIASKKGLVRTEIAILINNEIKKNEINIIVARSADFYGKDVKNSMFNEQVIKRIQEGKKANWFLDANKKHSLTLVSDAAKAIALLGNRNSAYNQVWHLPTDKAYTANELVQKIADITGKSAKIQVVSRFMITILSWFIPPIKESKELLYQYENDYDFKSTKFENAFKVKPTTIEEGLKQILK
ncbi:NAD-dependent epimerase/dehydratase family protein [Flavobacterium sp.]|uniref:NAD-dependent epimerase/dehydratase family protein n=1 Tax=Flavobacterium sp. TaxID=239 RepID=UPI00286D8EAD|nr:NAD-dependent epimerase/dehydratase family protein [Flavobacterium sp.]